MGRNFNKILFLTFTLIFFVLYSYKLPSSFVFESDFARDINDIIQIAQGKPMLIGPKLSFGGIYTGPYYYYLFVPIFFISRFNINTILFFNALIYSLSLGYFFKKISVRCSFAKAILATISIGLLPMLIFSARNPGNAFSYIPFLLFFLTYITFNDFNDRLILLFFLGFLIGFILNFHFINFIILAPLFLYIFMLLKEKKNIIYLLAGVVISFLPLMLFEIRHNFIMLKNTFINKSYMAFIENKNLVVGIVPNKNFYQNFLLISGQMKQWILFKPWIYFLTGGFVLVVNKKNKRNILLYITSVLGFIFLLLALRYQFAFHYLFPVSFLIIFVSILIIVYSRIWWLLFTLILLEVSFFPKYLYSNSPRQAIKFEKAVDFVIEHKLVEKNTSFNVIQIRPETNLTPIGHEYRFFFRKREFKPNSEFEYNKSRVLFVFSEINNYDIANLKSWEAFEFGKEYLKTSDVYKVNSFLTIYKLEKS